MGCMIGGATGVLLGGFSAFRMGLRGKEMLIQVLIFSVLFLFSFLNSVYAPFSFIRRLLVDIDGFCFGVLTASFVFSLTIRLWLA